MRTLVTVILVLSLCGACFCQEELPPGLSIATDPSTPPFEFQQEDGTIAGFDAEFLQAVAAVPSFQYNLIPTPWADIFQQVQNNQVDLAVSAITITDERKEIYDFSVPYFLSTYKILAPEGTDIQSAQDLVGRIVVVRDGTTGAAIVENIYGGDNANIRRVANQNDATQALINGEADAYVDDSGIIDYFANNNPGFAVIEDPAAFPSEFYGFMFPKGSPLVASFNNGITATLENGGYTTLYENWFGATPDVALLLAAGALEDPYDALGEEAEMVNEEDDLILDWENVL